MFTCTRRNPEDTEGREYVVLDAQMETILDPKKSFAFTVQLRGVPEPLCFGTEDEQVVNDWITRLENASSTKGKLRSWIIYLARFYHLCLEICSYMYIC